MYCPHVCGGSGEVNVSVSFEDVLSTRVWGKLPLKRSALRLFGTVHTCVGEA